MYEVKGCILIPRVFETCDVRPHMKFRQMQVHHDQKRIVTRTNAVDNTVCPEFHSHLPCQCVRHPTYHQSFVVSSFTAAYHTPVYDSCPTSCPPQKWKDFHKVSKSLTTFYNDRWWGVITDDKRNKDSGNDTLYLYFQVCISLGH